MERPHKLVAISARYLGKATPVGGVVSAPRSTCLDIEVSPGSLDRALRIMDALLRGLEAAGLAIEVAVLEEAPPAPRSHYDYGYGDEPRREAEPAPPERATRVRCEEEWIELRLTEHVRRVRDAGSPAPDGSRSRWDTAYDYEPTGKLALELTNVTAPGVRTRWQETKKQRLEEMLDEFVAYLPTVALSFKLEREEEARRRIAAREEELRRYEEQKRRWDERERRREEEKREQALEAEIARWRRAEDIREYVRAALAALEEQDPPPMDRQAERDRLRWALEYADRLDPLSG